MSRTPQKLTGSRAYREAWRAVNLLIRADGSWSGRERDVCYRNLGNFQFEDESLISGLDSAGDGRAFATFDFNDDGSLDLVLVSRTAPRLQLFRNQPPSGALLLELVGDGQRSNRDAIGAVAELETNRGRTLTRSVHAGGGYLSQSSRLLHFAFDSGERPLRLRILWPSGTRQVLSVVSTGGRIRLREGSPHPEKIARPRVWQRIPQPANPPSVWLTSAVSPPLLQGLPPAKRTLLNFWASWCPPCKQEMAEWAKAATQFRNAGLNVVLASVDEDSTRKPEAPFQLLHPPKRQIAAWNLFHRHLFDRREDIGLPTSFLLDENGKVIKVYKGVTPSTVILADIAAPARPSLPFSGNWYGPGPKRNNVELATALAEHGLDAESITYFEDALAHDIPTADSLNNYAGLLLEKGDLDRAEALLLRTLTAFPKQLDALANLGTLRLKQGQPGAARDAFQQVLAVQPDDAFALNGLGSALFAIKDIAAARKAFAEAVRLDAETPDYRFNLASLLAAMGDYRQALREFEQLRSAMPNSTRLANNLGILYVETSDTARGEQEFRRAIDMAPGEDSAYINLAMLLFQLGRKQDAVSIVQNLLALEPRNERGLALMDKFR